ncbi:MAG TPA: non-homologous end-joining DNA ligase [Phycicoccus sp.]|jgi:bifunctional non-homologous end joining protein LigD|nr:non-homologous end-joining DNA ligase [Phycicoccus sp.]HQH07822.1 non-homologous end-joining DNA ligase [Phycicoccus sp.]HQK30201.1 non-homologous end-joining DNA ligase [Phycicoccus sp.]
MPDYRPTITRVEVEGRTLKLTSLDKLLYPATETTKGEVLNYYATVAPILLEHMAARPVTRVRWPHGVIGDSFFEKNLPSGAPSWLERVRIDDVTYPLVPDMATLTYLVNLNSLEFHVPQWTVADGADGKPLRENPNRLVIDLDPGKPADLHECCQVALHLRERLDALGLTLFPVTSGSKGMQLYAALGGDLTSDQVRDLAQQLAQEMTKKFPELVLWKMTKSLRPDKVFFDWSQNVAAKTTISPYSLRGRELPCAAAPRTWDEVEAGAAKRGGIEQVMIDDMLERIGSGGIDEGGQLLADLP